MLLLKAHKISRVDQRDDESFVRKHPKPARLLCLSNTVVCRYCFPAAICIDACDKACIQVLTEVAGYRCDRQLSQLLWARWGHTVQWLVFRARLPSAKSPCPNRPRLLLPLTFLQWQ